MTLTITTPKTDAKARHDELLKAFEQKINEALEFAAIATELYALINEMACDLPEAERDEFFEAWFENPSYKKLEQLERMIHAVVWE